jgi:hypothetical protein
MVECGQILERNVRALQGMQNILIAFCQKDYFLFDMSLKRIRAKSIKYSDIGIEGYITNATMALTEREIILTATSGCLYFVQLDLSSGN